jgi:hypothetical protein
MPERETRWVSRSRDHEIRIGRVEVLGVPKRIVALVGAGTWCLAVAAGVATGSAKGRGW